MPLVLKELTSSDSTNRRNAAFCVGELCRNGGEGTFKYPCVWVYFFHSLVTFVFSLPSYFFVAVACDESF